MERITIDQGQKSKLYKIAVFSKDKPPQIITGLDEKDLQGLYFSIEEAIPITIRD